MENEGITELFYHSVWGYSGTGESIHIGMNGSFDPADRTVTIKTWGPDAGNEKQYRIPDDVETSKSAILDYLRHEEHVFIPM